MYKHLTVKKVAQVGYIQLNRPRVLNAFSEDSMKEIARAVDGFNDDAEIKAVVFSGAGDSFCSGFDVNHFSADVDAVGIRRVVTGGRDLVRKVESMRPVTVAAVQGHCVGGGMVLMMACDFRYASSDARFRMPEVDLGMTLGWGGVPWLVRDVGALLAMELVMTGREMDAQEALSRRLVNAMVSKDALLTHAEALANNLAERSAVVLEATKQQILAAKEELCAGVASRGDAHLVYSALLDDESCRNRAAYLADRNNKKRSPKLAVEEALR